MKSRQLSISIVLFLICLLYSLHSIPVQISISQIESLTIDELVQISHGKKGEDSLTSLISDIIAIQQSTQITDLQNLIKLLSARLLSLNEKTISAENEDQEKTRIEISNLQSQLVNAQLLLNSLPEMIKENELLMERSLSSANSTKMDIENIESIKYRYQKEFEMANAELKVAKQLHQMELDEISSDLEIVKSVKRIIQDLKNFDNPIISAKLHQKLIEILTLSHTSKQSQPKQLIQNYLESSSKLTEFKLTENNNNNNNNNLNTQINGCCTSYSITSSLKLCCFSYIDNVSLETCNGNAFGDNLLFYKGKTCEYVKSIYSDYENDPCSIQYYGTGENHCNDEEYCSQPSSCAFCDYDSTSDRCFTENCSKRMSYLRSVCINQTETNNNNNNNNCFPYEPSVECCEVVNLYQNSECDSNVLTCGASVNDIAKKCEKVMSNSHKTSIHGELLRILDMLIDDLEASKKSEEIIYANKMSQLLKHFHLVSTHLQETTNHIETLKSNLIETQQRYNSYSKHLQHLNQIELPEAERSVTNIPQMITQAKINRQNRKESREHELVVYEKVKKMIENLTQKTIPSISTKLPNQLNKHCYSFERPGYYYHANGPQPTEIICPEGSICVIEKLILNPMNQPNVFIVRMGCSNHVQQNSTFPECGATFCPSDEDHLYKTECCGESLCNGPDSQLAKVSYFPGECDTNTCSCNNETPKPVPSSDPSTTPTASTSRSFSSSLSATPSQSQSPSTTLTPTPSPSISSFPFSCDAIKREFSDKTSGFYQVTLSKKETILNEVYCDMEIDNAEGYTLLWKNVGGNLKHLEHLKSNEELLSSNQQDIVTPPFDPEYSQFDPDYSQINSKAFNFFASQNHTEWIKTMVLYDGNKKVLTQNIKVVMSDVNMNKVFLNGGKGHCVHTGGYFNLYSSETNSKYSDKISYFMGRTSIIDSIFDAGGYKTFGLGTFREGKCPSVHPANLITDTSKLRYLTDDLQFGSNEAWGTVQYLFSYEHLTLNPRDYSRCMFRCWNGRDGNYHETFVWSAKLGCPGYLFHTQQRCSGHGICLDGKCICDKGWENEDCGTRSEFSLCDSEVSLENGNVTCQGNHCDLVCLKGYEMTGPSQWQCSDNSSWIGIGQTKCSPICENNCNNHGTCVSPSTCECFEGFTGKSCNRLICKSELPKIEFGSIVCDSNQTNAFSCQVHCDNGFKVKGKSEVICDEFGMWSNDFDICTPYCQNECSGRGECVAPGKCVCFAGSKGIDCSECDVPDCSSVNQCSNNGLCISQDICYCNKGWDGPACSIKVRYLDDVALYLAGDGSQVIELPNMGTFNALTFEWWMFPEHLYENQMLLQPTENMEGSISIGFVSDQLVVEIQDEKTISFGAHFSDRIWTHVALTLNTVTHISELYVNGIKMDGVTISSAPLSIAKSRLGGLKSLLKGPYQGYIEEFRIWKNERTANQISANVETALQGTDDQLVALYPLSGPLSANPAYLDDLTGHYGVRITGGIWKQAPDVPPGSQVVPSIHHDAPAA